MPCRGRRGRPAWPAAAWTARSGARASARGDRASSRRAGRPCARSAGPRRALGGWRACRWPCRREPRRNRRPAGRRAARRGSGRVWTPARSRSASRAAYRNGGRRYFGAYASSVTSRRQERLAAAMFALGASVNVTEHATPSRETASTIGVVPSSRPIFVAAGEGARPAWMSVKADAAGLSGAALLAGWSCTSGASVEGDAARIGLVVAMAKRLGDQIMLMVARQRRGGGDELLSPLVMPALAVCEALASVLNYAGRDRSVRCSAFPRPRTTPYTAV